jgi:hypothetical protein
MVLSYYLLQVPTPLLFIGMTLMGGLSAGFCTAIFYKFVRVKILKSHNEVTGFLFTVVANLYAFLLGFVIFMVWGQLNDAQTNVNQEGSSAFGLYRDIKFYPDTIESKALMVIYLHFISNVLTDEFPNMSRMKDSPKTLVAFNQVFYKMERLNPENPMQVQLVGEMFHHLNQLAGHRGARTCSTQTEVPAPIWWVVLVGSIIVIFCAMLLNIENIKVHITLNSMLGAFIAMFFFIVIVLDHPFTGSLGIVPDAYAQIINMEVWAK